MSGTAERIARRALTVPTFVAAFVVGGALLPLILPVTLAIDVVRETRLGSTRAVLFGVYYFGCETFGILVSFGLWLSGRRSDAEAHYRLQSMWARALLAGARRIFGLRIEVEGADVIPRGGGPFLLLVRHVSVVDTVLAAVYLSARHGHRLRYVLKRELLWDPCLDIVGHRLPNCFVRRGAQTSSAEVARVRELARDLGPGDGVLIYPEGARFTPARREAVIQRFEAAGEPEWAERARSLERVLPPRLGGTLALIEQAPDADVVVCAHTGLERTMRLTDLVSGALVGACARVEFWRIPSCEIPRSRDERAEWLFATWARVDRWVADAA